MGARFARIGEFRRKIQPQRELTLSFPLQSLFPLQSPTPYELVEGRPPSTPRETIKRVSCPWDYCTVTRVRQRSSRKPTSPPCPLPTIAHSASRRALDWTQRAHHLESLRCGCTRIRTLHPMPMKSTWPWPRHTRRFCVRVTVLPKRMRYSPIHFPTFLAMVGRELSPKGAPILPSCSSAAASALLRSSATLRRHPWQTLRRIWAWTERRWRRSWRPRTWVTAKATMPPPATRSRSFSTRCLQRSALACSNCSRRRSRPFGTGDGRHAARGRE